MSPRLLRLVQAARRPLRPGPRRTGHPFRPATVERLEEIALLSGAAAGSVLVTGHVFVDVDPANPKSTQSPAYNSGHYTPAKTPVAGQTVEVLDASGLPQATARTLADGSFSLSVPVATQTVSQTVTLPSTLTNYNLPLSPALQLFNPSLGTLQSVTITTTTRIVTDVLVTNDGLATSSVTGGVDGAVNFTNLVPGGVAKLEGSSPTMSAVDVPSSGQKSFTMVAPISQFYVFDQPGDLAYYIAGAGRAALTPVADTSATVNLIASPNANTTEDATTHGSATVTVSYRYAPNLGTDTVTVVGAPAGRVFGKVALNGQVIASGTPSVGLPLVGGTSAVIDIGVLPAPSPVLPPSGTPPIVDTAAAPVLTARRLGPAVEIQFSGAPVAAAASRASSYKVEVVGAGLRASSARTLAVRSVTYDPRRHTVTLTPGAGWDGSTALKITYTDRTGTHSVTLAASPAARRR